MQKKIDLVIRNDRDKFVLEDLPVSEEGDQSQQTQPMDLGSLQKIDKLIQNFMETETTSENKDSSKNLIQNTEINTNFKNDSKKQQTVEKSNLTSVKKAMVQKLSLKTPAKNSKAVIPKIISKPTSLDTENKITEISKSVSVQRIKNLGSINQQEIIKESRSETDLSDDIKIEELRKLFEDFHQNIESRFEEYKQNVQEMINLKDPVNITKK